MQILRDRRVRAARILSLCAGGCVASGIASVAAANPSGARDGVPGVVRFDPTPRPSGAALVPSLPHPPINVTSPLTFNFTPVDNLLAMQSGTPAQQALATQVINSFVVAGDRWRALFADPITVNIDIDYGPIGNGVLGGASSVDTVQSYASVKTQLGLDSKSSHDATAVSNLQPGASMQFITNNTAANIAPSTSPRIRDNDTVGTPSGNNNFIDMNRANAKAIGIAVAAGSDANITFTDFTDFAPPLPVPPAIGWDFNPGDGIDANRIDFTGVATHEIGHVMGFVSGVDIVDFVASPNGPGRLASQGGPYDLNQFAVFNTLDLFRYSANSLAQGSQPAGGLRDNAMAQFNAGSRPYFSIDGGVSNLATFATGGFNGDGDQASHWQDNLGIGIMDPTFSLGELGAISNLDIRAMDVIGWDLQPVPEPASAGVIALGMLAMVRRHRKI